MESTDLSSRSERPQTTEEKLVELQQLRTKGLITDEEYVAKRAAILAGVGQPALAPQMQAMMIAPQTVAPRPAKDKSIAMLLQVILGLFGIYGIGFFYAGDNEKGLLWLIGGLVWGAIAIGIGVITLGFGICLTLPISIVVLILSITQMSDYTKQHPALFGP